MHSGLTARQRWGWSRLIVMGGLGVLAVSGRVAGLAAEPAKSPLFDIPRLDNVHIDGDGGEWGQGGFRVDALAPVDGRMKAVADLEAHMRLAWNDEGLLVLLTVRDDRYVENDDAETLWLNDCVELWLAERRGGSNLVQAIVAPGMDARHAAVRWRGYDHRKDAALKQTPPAISVGRRAVDGVCVIEALLPWSNVGVKARVGTDVGFQCYVDDSDSPAARPVPLTWYPALAPFSDTLRLQRLRLARKASGPVVAAGRVTCDGITGLRGTIMAPASWAGRPAALRVDGTETDTDALYEEGGRAWARLSAPFPAPGVTARTATLLVDGRVVDTIGLPDMAAEREQARRRLPFVFHPFCFDGETLPEGQFENPLAAQAVLGPHTVRIAYYDAGCRPVTSARKPGRYGARVDIFPRQGDSLTRFYTLYRMPAALDWGEVRLPVRLPASLGIPDPVAQDQGAAVEGFLKDQFADGLARSADSAVLFAWLSEAAPGTRTTFRTGPWSRNQRWIHDLRRATGRLQRLPYLAYVPDAIQKGTGRTYPAILFLHGSGERSIPLNDLGKQPIFTYARSQPDYPFILMAPQCPRDQWWDAPALEDLVVEVMAKYPIDPDRLYLTGLSMGGFGSWMLSIEHPEWFAAVAPICGGGDTNDVARIAQVPVWNFHGARDPTVKILRSDEMVAALRANHGRVRYTVYPEGQHNVWAEAYNTPELYAWLLRQVRGKPDEPPSTAEGPAPTETRPLARRP